ncbi:NAD(P)-binding protein [Mycena crocata]|nr:NAD(P)-binding protein [Mycena crocata]
MVPRILITGSTGYVGGSVLAAITTAHPSYHVTAVLRKVPQSYVEAYPQVKTIIGDFDSAEILAQAASENDIVIHAGDSDYKPAIEALLTGLGRRSTPTFFIHLSGTACISDVYFGNFGELNPRVWSDVEDIEEIVNLPKERIHRAVDEVVFRAAATYGAHIHTAIVCPPDVYGKGAGPGFTQSFLNGRSLAHIEDVMRMYVCIVEEAATSLETGVIRDGCWGKNGFYCTTTSELTWKEIAVATGKTMVAMGLIKSAEPTACAVEDVPNMVGSGGSALYMLGSNARNTADRGRKLLGWTPTGGPLVDPLEADLRAYHTRKERDVMAWVVSLMASK